MYKLIASYKKEFLVLVRDPAGLAVLFLMPMALVFIMSMIQDAPFRDYQEVKIPIVLVNQDQDSLGAAIEKGLWQSDIFELHQQEKSIEQVKKQVAEGDYSLGIFIPKGATAAISSKAEAKTNSALSALGITEETEIGKDKVEVLLILDPATKKSFKNAIVSSLQQFSTQLENQMVIQSFSKALAETLPDLEMGPMSFDTEELLTYKEIYAGEQAFSPDLVTNSVQHNVPAWTMFAMFFIVIPLAGHMIREREQGSTLRIRLIPGTNFIAPAGKVFLYVSVCMVQFFLLLLVGLWLLPLCGLPTLQLGPNFPALVFIALCAALAATGYGLLVGTIFKTTQQAMSFGSVSVIILAALGGIWVPSYVMPTALQTLGAFSPLNWGLEAFNDIFLRGGSWQAIFPEALCLLAFFGGTSGLAYAWNKLSFSR